MRTAAESGQGERIGIRIVAMLARLGQRSREARAHLDRYLENAPKAVLVPLSRWERAGVRVTRHDSRVFILRGDTGVMPG